MESNDKNWSTENLNDIGERIAKHFSENNLRIAEFSKNNGISKFTVSQWIKGKNITLDTVLLLADQFNLSINWLVLGLGEKQRAASIELSTQEEDVITICRHMNNNFAQATATFFQSINQYNANSKRIETYTGAENIFSETETARLIALTDGRIVESNAYFQTLIGVKDLYNPKKKLTIFSLVATDFQRRLKTDISTVLTVGVGQYNSYQFIHQQSGVLISVIAKSALIHFETQLAFEMIIKRV